MNRSILIIDDEESIRTTLEAALQDEGYKTFTAASGEEGLKRLKEKRPHVVLLDIWMPGQDGLETLNQIRTEYPDQLVIMMSGHGTVETAVKATKSGAYDFLEKPLSLDKLLLLIQNSFGFQELKRENQALRQQLSKQRDFVAFSPGMNKIQELIKQIAPTTSSVLVTGENGTGKELIAHSIHAFSSRYSRPFVEVNCAAIPEELIESELFGHEKGAFTGATSLKRGKFDLAHEGTLFLDEIGDMSLKTQAKILRIVQEQKFERVGGSQSHQVDVRIIAATNKDLKHEISQGRFREDLYHRLNVIPFHIPPLRDRKEDILPLATHFLEIFAQTFNRKKRTLTPEAEKLLQSYSWSGNVRELKNLIERVMILTTDQEDGTPIKASQLLAYLNDELFIPTSQTMGNSLDLGGLSKNFREARQAFEKEFIIKILKENNWNVSQAAQVLDIERSHLHKKMKTYGIESE